MSARERRRPPARSRPDRWRRTLPWVVLVVLAFVVGLSLGRALEEGPAPGGTQTSVRTLRPQPLPPAARTTVTVTVAPASTG